MWNMLSLASTVNNPPEPNENYDTSGAGLSDTGPSTYRQFEQSETWQTLDEEGTSVGFEGLTSDRRSSVDIG